MSIVEVKVPDIGDFKEVEIIEVMVKVGDTIKVDQSLITVESDKASMEIPSSAAGVVKEIKVKVGEKVAMGSLVLLLEADGAAAAPAPAAAPAAAAPAPAAAAPAPAPAAAPAASAGPVDVKVPDIGDFKEVEVIEVMVKVGDTIKVDQSLLTVESDKASMEIPSSHAGVVKEVKVKVGDKVAMGTVVFVVDAVGSPVAAAPAPAAAPAAPAPAAAAPSPAPAPAAAAAAPTASQGSVATGKLAHASPSIRKFARELGVDLGKVPGSGPKGRITQIDVQNYVKGVIAGTVAAPSGAAGGAVGGGGNFSVLPWPSLDFSKFGETELLPLSRIKKISGPNLHRNWVQIPHVTQFDDADITDLEAFRVESNAATAKNKDATKLTMLAFVIKASVAALKKFPTFNSSLDAKGENLILKKYYNIGFAADTPNGLVVPVIKNADQKSVTQIAKEMTELSLQAREGKLKPADMQGATFTISSLGGIGGTHFTPIVNAPEVAILGLSKASLKPVWDGKAFQPRLLMGTSLSYDHRVVDGAMGARFSVYLSEVLGDMRKILL
ncbi:dihydrolipoyllysine-residue acetyltransferase [Duganella dendranthematis]|uniref:Acetyltransferase component of pyruvate dehydrogenase complex n=1 Tax=Duganella dendranthematis TaxID=2728021 RepID=A0ABX6M5D4_9BURK|nr:dihydrolipoyllysine-residue acetyltransferase [Duganella dendranthematis]QJD89512.1 dihydrolipoyllysine-residue acetyltransferase [Duganella dendranthematis]